MPFISYVKACLNIWWEHKFTKVLGIKLSFFTSFGVCTDILAMLVQVTIAVMSTHYTLATI